MVPLLRLTSCFRSPFHMDMTAQGIRACPIPSLRLHTPPAHRQKQNQLANRAPNHGYNSTWPYHLSSSLTLRRLLLLPATASRQKATLLAQYSQRGGESSKKSAPCCLKVPLVPFRVRKVALVAWATRTDLHCHCSLPNGRGMPKSLGQSFQP